MDRKEYSISPKASISLQTMLQTPAAEPEVLPTARWAGLARPRADAQHSVPTEEARVRVIVETRDDEVTGNELISVGASRVQRVASGFLSAEVPLTKAAEIYKRHEVKKMQTLKRKKLLMDSALVDGAVSAGGGQSRIVGPTGRGCLVAVCDSGFDLTHPMFRDSAGKLRVDALLDQTQNDREFTTAQLESAVAAGRKPGEDEHGHGTHVATIAAGSPFERMAGVAPDARFLLIKSDMQDLAAAASWAFRKAGNKPCVVNFSLGHHFGAHDGTDQEERAFQAMSGPGKVILVAAGNERGDNIHIGMRFSPGQTEAADFDITPEANRVPQAAMTLWYRKTDKFAFTLVSPSGARMAVPAIDRSATQLTDGAKVTLSRQRYQFNDLIQVQIEISFTSVFVPPASLARWRIVVACEDATVGRVDGWFFNSGFAKFRPNPMLESARTIGLPASGDGVLAVASHVSKNKWQSDQGEQRDANAVIGRSSVFSSLGPTRDGRQKPDISAPGQYLTAALAAGSQLAGFASRVNSAARLLSIEGTSMATPFMTGVVALMLEERPTLTVDQIRSDLKTKSVKDQHTGTLEWTPEFGYGKVSAEALLTEQPARSTPTQPPSNGVVAALGIGARKPSAKLKTKPRKKEKV